MVLPDPGRSAVAGAAAADRVLGALHRPYDPVAVLGALLGLPAGTARRVVGAITSTGPEAEVLLDTMPRTIRSLAMSTTDTPVRCAGEVRGPVLWSETIAARASVAGDPGVVVCASPARAFDTAENRVLVTALELVVRCAHAAEGLHGAGDLAVVHRARHNAHRAVRYLDHQALAAVPSGRPDRRAARRARTGTRRGTYRHAVRFLDRAAAPFDGTQVATLGTDPDRERLATLAALLDAAAAAGVGLAPLRAHHGELVSGPVRFRHPDQTHDGGGPPGLWVDSTEVHGPEGAAAGAALLASLA